MCVLCVCVCARVHVTLAFIGGNARAHNTHARARTHTYPHLQGGWTQVLCAYMCGVEEEGEGVREKIIAVDLQSMAPIPGVRVLKVVGFVGIVGILGVVVSAVCVLYKKKVKGNPA